MWPAVALSIAAAESGSLGRKKMKLTSKEEWKSLMPLCVGRKHSIPFCIFPKFRSASQSPGNVPVYLNVYDLTPMNGYMYWVGLGVFHTGVEVHGIEYAFGAHDYPISGVFEVEPRLCPGFRFRKSIFMGTTCLDSRQVREFMELQSVNYNGDTYHLIVKNCNHFCKDIIYKLTGNSVPKWVNRLARIGSYCNCLLPDALKIAVVQQDPDSSTVDAEKRRLRTAFSCLSSISMHPRHFSLSSLFLPSSFGGCLPPWQIRGSTAIPLKDHDNQTCDYIQRKDQ